MAFIEQDILDIRAQFPLIAHGKMHGKPLIYLDSAATTQKHFAVVQAIHDFYTYSYGTINRAVYGLAAEATTQVYGVREKVAHFFGASSASEIVFTQGTTDGINLVATSFCQAFMKPGEEILVTEIEHHANLVPWQVQAQERGFKLRFIPVLDNGEIDLEEFRKLLNPQVKILSLPHISNLTGTIYPIQEIIEMAHSVGAKVLIDGAQSASHEHVDVQKLDIDFFVCSGHKMFGPTGVGVLYGKKELLDKMPPHKFGGDMIEEVSLEHTTYQEAPFKFEAGTQAIAQIIGLGAAIDEIQNIGISKIKQWEEILTSACLEKLSQIPRLRLIGSAKNRGPIISFVIDGIHHLDLGALLDLKGIAIRTGHVCCQPAMKRFHISGVNRVSFSIYNTLEEINLFIENLLFTKKSLW